MYGILQVATLFFDLQSLFCPNCTQSCTTVCRAQSTVKLCETGARRTGGFVLHLSVTSLDVTTLVLTNSRESE